MGGLTMRHVYTVLIGGAIAVTGAWAPAIGATALIALGTSLATGALAHAQGAKKAKDTE